MKELFAKRKRPEELQTPFAYAPLKSNEIRLLRLKPSKPLSGSLKTIRIQDHNDWLSTEFEALSYCWGDQAADRTLLLDNSPFSIKPNLEAALRELSKGKVERLLWIDAICINQADLKERSEQVRMMSSIYRQAKQVIIWIGPCWVGRKSRATDAIEDFAQRQRDGTDSQQLSTFLDNPRDRVEYDFHYNGYTEAKAVDNTGGHWPGLVDFFDRPWWRRVWVRQELAMSQRAIVQCGDKTVKWADVAAISHWLNIWIPDLDERSRKWRKSQRAWWRYLNDRSGTYTGEDLEYFRDTLAVKGEIEFNTMLIHARNCESSDPRDKVYSILGLTGKSANDIIIDYSLPVSAVAIQAFRKQADQNESLDALIWSQNPGKRDGIPTWAPNLYTPFISQPSRLKGKDFSLYAAAGILPSTERFEFLEDEITLEVQGVTIFDRVTKLSQVLSDSRHITDSQLDDTMFKWKPLVFKWLGSMDVEHKYERFMSALTCDRAIRGRRLPKRADGLDWATYFRISHQSVGARTEFEYLALAVRMSMFQGTTSGQTELSDWLKLCAESVGGRKIIMTAGGRIGLVPAQTREADVVCLLGLDVPFILRAIEEDTYVVIGEAYVHGVMDGEIVNARGAVRDIRLQ